MLSGYPFSQRFGSEGGLEMKLKMMALIPYVLMLLMYGKLPDMAQTLKADIALFNSNKGVTVTEMSNSGNTESAKKEISIDSFPKRETDKDDTERIQRAVDYCLANGKDLFFPSGGSYVLRSVNVAAGLRLVGYGATFTLADNQPKFTRMFTTENRAWKSAKASDYLIFEGMTFDGNCWNQGPFLNYEMEQQFGIMYMGSTDGTGMLRGKVISCRFQNWAADGVHIYTNADVEVTGSSSINCFRGGIVASGSPSNIRVTDFVAEKGEFGKAMDFEIDTAAKMNLTVDSVRAYRGVDIELSEGSTAKVEGLTVVDSLTTVYGFKDDITINNSSLGHLEVINATNTTINNSTITATPSTTEDVDGAYVWVVDSFDALPKEDYYTVFNNCTFVRSDKDNLVETGKEINAVKGYFGKIALNDCTIGKGFTKGYYGFGVAYSYLTNVVFDSDTAVAMQPLSWARTYQVVLDNVQYGENNSVPYLFLDYMETAPYTTVVFKNMTVDSTKAGYAGAEAIGTTKIESSRIISVAADPTTTNVPGFIGDTARLATPVEGQAYEWVATTSDPVAATWEVSKQ
jgi:hypothetical protein